MAVLADVVTHYFQREFAGMSIDVYEMKPFLRLQDTNKVLAISRIMVAWQPLGLAMGTYDMCNRYLQQRQQFGSPLAAFQVNIIVLPQPTVHHARLEDCADACCMLSVNTYMYSHD